MADVTEAPTQDAIAESLLGDEPQEQVAEETPETEQQQLEEVQEQPLEQEQTEEQTEETGEDWLPSEQDKQFSEESLLRYAQRYQKDEEWLSDPLNRQLLIDKLNTDIFVRQQQQRLELEPEEPEQPAETQQTVQEPQLDRNQYFQSLERLVQERTDPEVAKSFHADFLRAFGVPDAEIAKAPQEQAMRFTQTASKYMLNLMNTFMGDMLGARLNGALTSAFPGFDEMYTRSANALAWDRVRNSSPSFAELPAYGTKEFRSKMREAAQHIPEIAEMVDEADGKPQNMQQAIRWYGAYARAMTNQVNPALIQQAVATGARNARRADVRRSAGNLGSGKSTSSQPRSQASGSPFETNQDIFDNETISQLNKRL